MSPWQLNIQYCIFLLMCFGQLNAQYITSDYVPSGIVNNAIYAPGRMAIDSDDNVYVTDAFQNIIVKYDKEGNILNTISPDFYPIAIAIDRNNQLYVGDEGTGNIYKVYQNGTKTLFYEGSSRPNSMAFGLDILYITVSEQKKVIGLDKSGNVVTDFTYDSFTFITGIAFDKQNNRLFVAEHGGIGEEVQSCGSGGSMGWSSTGPLTTIYIFDIEGNLINNFGCFGTNDGQFQRVQGITVGACGNLYVADPYLGRVSVFDPDGNYITKFGSQGNNAGEFNLATDIVFSSDNRAFVSSMNKGAVDAFSIISALPTSTITGDDKTILSGTTTEITVAFTGVAPWTFSYTQNDLSPIQITTSDSPFSFPVGGDALYEISALIDGEGTTGTCFTGSIKVKTEDAPTATLLATDLVKCTGDSTGIDIQFTGKAPWTFEYAFNGSSPTEITTEQDLYKLNVDQPGLYEFFNLSDKSWPGESVIGSATVVINPLPTATTIKQHESQWINKGDTADFEISFSGTAPYTFTYMRDFVETTMVTTSDNPYVLSLTEFGTYEFLTIADSFCNNSDLQIYIDIFYNKVIPPTATLLTADLVKCIGDTIGIDLQFTGMAPWTFEYTIDGTSSTSITADQDMFTLNAAQPGLYEFINLADNTGVGDRIIGSILVNVNPLPTVSVNPNDIEKMIDQGTSADIEITFTGSAPYTFTYSLNNLDVTTVTTSDNPYIMSVTEEGNYDILSVSDVNCFNDNGQGFFDITYTEVIPPTATILTTDLVKCTGDSFGIDLQFTGKAPWTFAYTIDGTASTSITTDQILYTLDVDQPGLYEFINLADNVGVGDSIIGSILVNVNPLPTASVNPNDIEQIIDLGATADIEISFIGSAPYTFTYMRDSVDTTTITTADNPYILTVSDKGAYDILSVSDVYCYNNNGQGYFDIAYTDNVSSINHEAIVNDEINIYPNPSNGEFTIELCPKEPISGPLNILIHTISGETIYSGLFDTKQLPSDHGKIFIDIRIGNYSFGSHIVTVNASNFVGDARLILQH